MKDVGKKQNLKEITEKLYSQILEEDTSDMSQIAQAMEVINKDKTDSEGLTSIDLNTELTQRQIEIVTKLQALSLRKIYPEDTINRVIRIFKRNMVSLNRKGRKETVGIAQGMKEDMNSESSFFKRLVRSNK